MNKEKMISLARTLNLVEIIMTLVVFIAVRIINKAVEEGTALEENNELLLKSQIILGIYAIISVVVIAFTGIMMAKNKYEIKGLGLLLSSGIITLFFSLTGLILGLVIFITSGLSLKKLADVTCENSFEARLKKENVVADVLAETLNEEEKKEI